LAFDVEDVFDNAVDCFGFEQRLLYNIVFDYFVNGFDNAFPFFFRFNVDSKGGIDKFYIINILSIYIRWIIIVYGLFDSDGFIVCVVFIGVIVNVIYSIILYSFFRLSVASSVLVLLVLNGALEL